MCGLDGTVCDGCEDTEGPGITVGEHRDGDVVLLVQSLDQTPRAPGGLTAQVYECAVVLLREPVLDETGEHSSCLYRHDEVHVPGFDLESILFHFVRDGESGFRDVVDTVVGLPCSLGFSELRIFS